LPYRLEYPFVKGNVPNPPLDLVFDQFFASSGFSCVYQLDEVDATVSDTDPRVMSMFDLRVPNVPLDLVFDQFFASSGFSRVYQLDEVDATVSDRALA
jgi:hypothetical protein